MPLTSLRRVRAPLGFCVAFLLTSVPAFAQDLFELEVFQYESTPPGEYEVELHANGMRRGGAAAVSQAGGHRPIHLSIELTRGWSSRFETALFVQMAPFGPSGTARFAGGHLRGKVRLGELPALGLGVAVSAEYAFNRAQFNDELQTLEARSILDFARGRLSLIANPSIELVTSGDEHFAPVFDVSARAAWRVAQRVGVTSEYFTAGATTRHLRREPDAHDLVFAGFDVEVGSRWELAIAAGRCVTRGERWVMKSVIGLRFH